MDRKALVETLFDLWQMCEDEYKRRFPNELPINVDVVRAVFERADHHIIASEIRRERQGVRADREKEDVEPPTEKQLDYIEFLGGDRRKPRSKEEASEYIEELRRR